MRNKDEKKVKNNRFNQNLNNFLSAPFDMKKVCVLRFLFGIVITILGIFAFISIEDIQKYELGGMLILLGFVFLIMGISVFFTTINEQYQYIECMCVDIEFTPVKQTIKYVYVVYNGEKAKIAVKNKKIKFAKGEKIYLYLPLKKYYSENGVTLINSYYSIGIANQDKQPHA